MLPLPRLVVMLLRYRLPKLYLLLLLTLSYNFTLCRVSNFGSTKQQ